MFLVMLIVHTVDGNLRLPVLLVVVFFVDCEFVPQRCMRLLHRRLNVVSITTDLCKLKLQRSVRFLKGHLELIVQV